MRTVVLTSLLALALAGGCGSADDGEGGGLFGWLEDELAGREPYALDDLSREVSGEEVKCDREALETYRGEKLQYQGALRVHPAFVERLARFEAITSEVSRELYGREPRRIRHAGSFACRTVRGRGDRLSEHALGNALDLTGFSFGRLPRQSEGDAKGGGGGAEPEAAATDEPAADLPPRLRRPFRVTVRQHWEAEDEDEAIHQRFLRTLVERLEDERVFRGMIGPSQPGHESHLHLDAGPYRYVRL